MSDRFATMARLIDEANGADPNKIAVEGSERPAELVYSQRMTAALKRFAPQASEHLHIAARGQHIERWRSPRADYPEGRVGYLKWRKDLKDYHARRLGELMREAGYGEADIERVAALVRKERMKRDEEAQTLEDVICLVFLESYFEAFAAKHEEAKVIDILRKTWRKMSKEGQAAALRLELPPRAARLVEAALSGD
jgi:hypothetical protein